MLITKFNSNNSYPSIEREGVLPRGELKITRMRSELIFSLGTNENHVLPALLPGKRNLKFKLSLEEVVVVRREHPGVIDSVPEILSTLKGPSKRYDLKNRVHRVPLEFKYVPSCTQRQGVSA